MLSPSSDGYQVAWELNEKLRIYCQIQQLICTLMSWSGVADPLPSICGGGGNGEHNFPCMYIMLEGIKVFC